MPDISPGICIYFLLYRNLKSVVGFTKTKSTILQLWFMLYKYLGISVESALHVCKFLHEFSN